MRDVEKLTVDQIATLTRDEIGQVFALAVQAQEKAAAEVDRLRGVNFVLELVLKRIEELKLK